MSSRLVVVVIVLVVMSIGVLGLHACKVNPVNELGINNPTDDTESQAQMEFQTVSRGYCSGQTQPACYVIKNEQEWTDVWRKHTKIILPQHPLPQVNFSNTMIIAVFMGEFNTGGYGIEIKEIVETNQSVEVKVEKTYPGKRCIVTMAFSQPYHIVKAERIDKEVTFNTVEVITECR